MTSPELSLALRQAARAPRLLVASDYDGCLSPIVPDPAAAVPLPAALDAFVAVSLHSNVHAAIVSGRSPEILEQFVGHRDTITLIGNHGSQHDADGDILEAVAHLTRDLRAVADAYPGSVVEPKSLGAAFHHRHVTDERSAIDAANAVAADRGARTITGKKVLEFVFGEGDKGTAIARLAERWDVGRTVFFGDDVTDEAVFAILEEDDIGIKVGDGETRAGHRVPDPEGVAEALRELEAALRS